MNWKAYLRLSRFDKPAGIALLWSPTAWALWIANQGFPPLKLIILFFLGTLFMRAAGCVVNDIADRQIDLHVQRTKHRPLATGEISLIGALLLLMFFLFSALLILLQLPSVCFYYSLVALGVTILYPFCKRFIQCPQLVLGIAFSMGIPMAFAASHVAPNASMGILLAINFAWILAYDTQYAMADRADDLRISVQSTAIFFAAYDRIVIACLQIFFHGLWLVLAFKLNFSKYFYIGWGLAALVLIYQQSLLVVRQEEKYLQAFSSNSWYGLVMWVLGVSMVPIYH